MGSPIDSDGEDEANSGGSAPGIHLLIMRITRPQGTVFSSHTHTFAPRQEMGPANSCGFHEQVPRHVPDSDRQELV